MHAEWIERFIQELNHLEACAEIEGMVALFTAEAGLWTVTCSEPVHGKAAVREFWDRYRSQFATICSTFERVIEGEDEAALEWHAEGQLIGGQPVAYRGVTILRRGPSGLTELSSYYDPHPFARALRQPALTPASGSGPRMAGDPTIDHVVAHEDEAEDADDEVESDAVLSYG